MKLLLSFLVAIELYAAQSGVYVELSAGIDLDDTLEAKNGTYIYDKEYMGSFALGYQADLFRFELEGRYKKDTLYSLGEASVDGDLEQTSQMLNLYYSGYNTSKFVSSVGAGVGLSSITLQDTIEDTNILSYQGIFSVGYMLSKSSTITTEYTYFYTQASDNFKSNTDSSVSLNYRYLF